MKLAEALIIRSDIQKRIENLKQRLLNNAKIQEGELPCEDPDEILNELEQLTTELTSFVQRINRTNVNTYLIKNETIADAIAIRDTLKIKLTIYRELVQAATQTQGRYSRSEIKIISAVNVSEIQKTTDKMAKEYRELDASIQAINWITDLNE